MTLLENAHFSVEYDPNHRSFQIRSRLYEGCELHTAAPSLQITRTGQAALIETTAGMEPKTDTVELAEIGPAVRMTLATELDGIHFQVETALPERYPLVLMRVTLKNGTDADLTQEQFTLLETSHASLPGSQTGKANPGCYVNGWQSWSYSGSYGSNQKPVVTHLGPFQQPKLYDSATPFLTSAGTYASEMFGILLERTQRRGWLAGFLSQTEHFGHVVIRATEPASIIAHAAGDGAVVRQSTAVSTDWFAVECIDLDGKDALGGYMDASAAVNHVQIREQIPVGWCSWYHYFTRISPEVIRQNMYELAELREQLPVDLVQMDDGFEKFVGDWLTPRPVFTSEMDLLAEDIKEEKFTPGIWLAPFIVSPASETYKQHGEWLIHKPNGKPANAGWNWEGFCSGLDLTHPQVKEYIRKVISTAVEEWGYPYLKLDFLYAGALPGKRNDPTKTRARALRDGMELIRAVAGPDVYLLGCGAPLGSMLGIVDGMRISTDVAPDWDPKYMGLEYIFPNDPDIPSARSAIQNTLTRSFMHNRWWQNDPDCLLLRPTSNLTLAEVQSLATTIFMSGGLLLLSDSMHEVSGYRLRIAQAMLPLIGRAPRVVDWADRLNPRFTRHELTNPFGKWSLLSYLNWENKPVQIDLTPAEFADTHQSGYILREYWSGKSRFIHDGHIRSEVATHGSALFALRQIDLTLPAYLGGDVHLSQGMELADWQPSAHGLTFKLALNHQSEGSVDLYLPGAPAKVTAGDEDVTLHQLDDHIYRLDVIFDKEVTVVVKYAG